MTENVLDRIAGFWDAQAVSFDDEPDHGLADPVVRDAWTARLRSWLPAPPAEVAELGYGTGTLSVLLADVGSFACPPGVVWGTMKGEQGWRIAAWLASRTGPTIAGIDRNGPKYEHDDGSVQLWPHDAPELLGPEPAHRCHDALAVLYEREHHRREQAAAWLPDGPLAVSYVRGHPGQRQTRCRYDAVYVSDHVTVDDVPTATTSRSRPAATTPPSPHASR